MGPKNTASKKAKNRAEPGLEALRAHLEPTAPNFDLTLEALRQALARLEPPPQPEAGDLVLAVQHIIFADGLPCAVGQEANRRLEQAFVNRNEFRLTEAFEIEELLADLEMPNAFQRCFVVREVVAEIYNDQNDISLEFLRQAMVTERNQFLARAPALRPRVARFLTNLIAYEEIILSDRSTLRVQQRVGLEPKDGAVGRFLAELRRLLAPFGHLPLLVSPVGGEGEKVVGPAPVPAPAEPAELSNGAAGAGGSAPEPCLCPACLVLRLAPRAKGA